VLIICASYRLNAGSSYIRRTLDDGPRSALGPTAKVCWKNTEILGLWAAADGAMLHKQR
jgi:hypothetical protein